MLEVDRSIRSATSKPLTESRSKVRREVYPPLVAVVKQWYPPRTGPYNPLLPRRNNGTPVKQRRTSMAAMRRSRMSRLAALARSWRVFQRLRSSARMYELSWCMRQRKAKKEGVGRYWRQGRMARRFASAITGRYSCGNTCMAVDGPSRQVQIRGVLLSALTPCSNATVLPSLP